MVKKIKKKKESWKNKGKNKNTKEINNYSPNKKGKETNKIKYKGKEGSKQ